MIIKAGKGRQKEGAFVTLFLLSIFGLLSGFINGLLGAGGGILAVFILSRLLLKDTPQEKDGEKSVKSADIFAMSLLAMLPISILSCLFYSRSAELTLDGFGIFILPAIIGGIIGALLLDRIPSKKLKRLFAILVIYSGIMMMIR